MTPRGNWKQNLDFVYLFPCNNETAPKNKSSNKTKILYIIFLISYGFCVTSVKQMTKQEGRNPRTSFISILRKKVTDIC